MKYSRRRRKPMKRWSRTSQTGKTQKAVGSLIPVIPETVRTRTVFFLFQKRSGTTRPAFLPRPKIKPVPPIELICVKGSIDFAARCDIIS